MSNKLFFVYDSVTKLFRTLCDSCIVDCEFGKLIHLNPQFEVSEISWADDTPEIRNVCEGCGAIVKL